jgi:hypothetical protein
MNKSLILLVLVVIVVAQWSFVSSSFYTASTPIASFRTINASGTSAVIVAKADFVSVRVKFFITAEPGRTALVVFPDGSQENVTSSYGFETFLARTGFSPGSFAATGPGGLIISDSNPVAVAVVSNVTESFFTENLGPYSSGAITFYWFKVQGNAQVRANCYGVSV